MLVGGNRQQSPIQSRPADAESRALNAEAMLDASGTASILVDGDGRVVHMNRPAQVLAGAADGFRMCADRISPADSFKRTAFRALVTAAANDPGEEGAIILDRRSEKRPLLVLVSPFRHAAHGLAARVLISVTDPELVVSFSDAVLRAFYDFTPAETEIANRLLTGNSLEKVAELRRTSLTTVRSQMKALLRKTDTQRQAELICLLSSLPRTASAQTAHWS